MDTGQTTRPPEDPRTRLAGERTLLAWIRTGLAMMGFGFVVARFGLFLRELAAEAGTERQAPGFSLWIGTTLVLFGVAVNLIAAAQHLRFLRNLEKGEPYQPPRWPVGVIVAVILALLGLTITGYLLFLHV
jgi:putative membrane protein